MRKLNLYNFFDPDVEFESPLHEAVHEITLNAHSGKIGWFMPICLTVKSIERMSYRMVYELPNFPKLLMTHDESWYRSRHVMDSMEVGHSYHILTVQGLTKRSKTQIPVGIIRDYGKNYSKMKEISSYWAKATDGGQVRGHSSYLEKALTDHLDWINHE